MLRRTGCRRKPVMLAARSTPGPLARFAVRDPDVMPHRIACDFGLPGEIRRNLRKGYGDSVASLLVTRISQPLFEIGQIDEQRQTRPPCGLGHGRSHVTSGDEHCVRTEIANQRSDLRSAFGACARRSRIPWRPAPDCPVLMGTKGCPPGRSGFLDSARLGPRSAAPAWIHRLRELVLRADVP
jgi:hypothetical protein